jgi:hypothetical protein
MALGPVQMLVVGFVDPDFKGEVLAELERLRESDTIRVLDLVVVAKDETGDVRVVELKPEENGDGDGRLALKLLDGADVDLSHLDAATPGDLWSPTDAIPAETAAAVALIEHRWAIPLRDAIAGAGGLPLADAWLAPDDLASIGLVSA